ncbi:MAG: RimK/LysX family protein [Nanoarchaeota archaeon]|nr:RimK/LysX family protein [Nanoarchaeota archaeon]
MSSESSSDISNRTIIGLIETITLENGKSYKAKIDTGADSSSIDINIAKQFDDKKILAHKYIRSALGRHRRPVISLGIEIKGKKCVDDFTISDRKNLSFKILIGKDILQKEEFMIDPLLDPTLKSQKINDLSKENREEVKNN